MRIQIRNIVENYRTRYIGAAAISYNPFAFSTPQTLKLGDFGCAVKIKAHTTMPGELQGFVGTQAYMAPEVSLLPVKFNCPKGTVRPD
jgi:serine/threonine protein kinase